jgi:hypothetical protein
LHSYIRIGLLHLGTIFFILGFPFILEIGPDACPLSLKYRFYPYYKLLVHYAST